MKSLKRLGQSLLPKRLHPVGAAVYWLGTRYRCPVCGWPARAFRPLAFDPAFPERCCRCGSLARHRLLWLFLRQRTEFFTAPLKVLHFSAEACFIDRFSRLNNLDYTTADINGGYTSWMETLDVTSIAKPDNTYDVILCIHVLQAVEDDLRAMREILRVLRPGGWAVLNSRYDPKAEHTEENPGVAADGGASPCTSSRYRVSLLWARFCGPSATRGLRGGGGSLQSVARPKNY